MCRRDSTGDGIGRIAPMSRAGRALAAIGLALLAACAHVAPDSAPPTAGEGVSKAPAAAPLLEPAARAEFERALAALKAGRTAEAEQGFGEVLRTADGFAPAHADLGLLYYRTGRTEQAAAALGRAIALDPRPAYYNQLGIAYRALGRFAEARQAYEAALRNDPNYANAHYNLGILCDLYLNDWPSALAHYARYQALAPEDGQVAKWIIDLKQRDKTARKENG